MEQEIDSCFNKCMVHGIQNVVVMSNRLIAEFHDTPGIFWITYPLNERICRKGVRVDSIENTNEDRFKYPYTDYVSEQYDYLPTYHCICQLRAMSCSHIMQKIQSYYESIDPKKKLVYFNDYDLIIAYP